jgi:tetratricopeptide (TPR) repeat protein
MPDPIPPGAPRPRHATALVLGAVALVALVVYANALRNGYALDDDPIIWNNRVVHGLGDLHGLLLGPYWTESGELYRPVTLVSFALGWALHGPSPAWMHALNVLLHAACSALVALLVLRLRGGRTAALLAGLLFAVHPVHVEAVANGVGRAEILATIFVLAGCLVYLGGSPRAPGRIAAVAALYFLALGSKEISVAFPALLLVLDALRARGERKPARRILLDNLPLLAGLTLTLAGYLALRVVATDGLVGTDPAPYLVHVSASQRVATAVRLWPEYLRLLLWPADLSAEWGPDTIRVVGWSSPRVWFGAAVGVALAACAVLSWRRNRWVAAAVGWLALAVLPVSNLIFPIGVLLSERSLYLPSVALAFLFPPLVAAVRGERRESRTLGLAAAGVLLALAAARTWTRTPVWKSSNAVLYSMMEGHPELWWVEWNAGHILRVRGRYEEALPWFRKAMRKVNNNHEIMDLDYVTVLRDAGRFHEAEPILRFLTRTFRKSVPPYTLLASLLIDEGRYAEVPPLMDAAAAIPRFGPMSSGDIQDRRALAYDGMGDLPRALAARRATLRDSLYVRGFAPWYHYARLLTQAGDSAGARAALDSARVRTTPRIRAVLTLDPLPALQSPLLRGWGKIPGADAPPAAPPAAPEGGIALPRGG